MKYEIRKMQTKNPGDTSGFSFALNAYLTYTPVGTGELRHFLPY